MRCISKMVECSCFRVSGLGNGAWWQLEESNVKSCKSALEKPKTVFDEELYVSCMKRFLYVRCYDSLELLSSLKVVFSVDVTHIVGFVLDTRTLLKSLYHYVIVLQTLHYRIRQQEACGSQVGVLMIDRFVFESTSFSFS